MQKESNSIIPNTTDVLCGRGKFSMNWEGNIYYKTLVDYHKSSHRNGDHNVRSQITNSIIETIGARIPPGRFLNYNKDKETWYDIGNNRVHRKIKQALREGNSTIEMKQLHGDEKNSNQCLENKKLKKIKDRTVPLNIEHDKYYEKIKEEFNDWSFVDEDTDLSKFNPKEVFFSDSFDSYEIEKKLLAQMGAGSYES